jgi:prepilin-type N-terminal cleavage/methylation domain-containing protein
MKNKQKGFTLIEILIVIAIIAVLAVVAVLTINPSGIFKGQRDASRVSSLTTITNAVAFAKANGLSLGTPGVAYVSVPDPTLTGTQTSTCSSLGLPAIPSATYQCVSAANLTKTDGTGWIPVTFNTLPGSPLGVLPIDPVNSASSGEYFIYATDGSGYEALANAEVASDTTNDALTQGTNLALVTSFPTSGNPVPTLTSISPSNWNICLNRCTGTDPLTVAGTGFVSSSVVYWSSSWVSATLATTYISSSSLTAQIPVVPELDTQGGTASITVINPAPGGGTSAVQYFTVNGHIN